MKSRNISKAASRHLGRVKELPCSVCDKDGPSAAHHIVQGAHFVTVALCYECHQGRLGWHGDKTLWRIRKMDELAALNITLGRLND